MDTPSTREEIMCQYNLTEDDITVWDKLQIFGLEQVLTHIGSLLHVNEFTARHIYETVFNVNLDQLVGNDTETRPNELMPDPIEN